MTRPWPRPPKRAKAQPAPSVPVASAAPVKQPAPAAPKAEESTQAKKLLGVEVAEDGASVSLKLDGSAACKYFTMKDPDRVVVDLPGIARGSVPGETAGAGDIARVRVSLFQASPVVTRVVLDMKTTAPKVAVDPNGAGLTVLLGQGSSDVAKKQAPAPQPAPAPAPAPAPVEQAQVQAPAPVATPAPVEQAQVQAPAPVATPAPAEQAQIQAPAPVSTPAPAPAPEPATPAPQEMAAVQPAPVQAPPPAEAKAAAQSLDQIKVDLSPIDPKASKEFKGYEDLFVAQDTSQHSAESKTLMAGGVPLSFKEKTISGGEAKYTGEPISLSLKDADVKDVLRVFHDISKMNIVVHPGVQGRVTVDLENVPWDQAMDIILKNNGLDYIYENNVIWVAPAAEIARQFADVQRLQKERLNAEEPITFTKRLSYAKAGNMVNIAKRFMSDRGNIIIDDRTNTMIIEEVPSKKESLIKLIDSLDTATPQVLIEARIVETNITWDQSFGIVWSGNWYTARTSAGNVRDHQPGLVAHGRQHGYAAHNFNNSTGWPNYGHGRLRGDPAAYRLQRLHRPGLRQHHGLLLPGRPAGGHGELGPRQSPFRPAHRDPGQREGQHRDGPPDPHPDRHLRQAVRRLRERDPEARRDAADQRRRQREHGGRHDERLGGLRAPGARLSASDPQEGSEDRPSRSATAPPRSSAVCS